MTKSAQRAAAPPPLHQHGAFDDLDAALYGIHRLSDALRGIGNLLQVEKTIADEQLNMARRSDASAVFGFFGELLNEYRETAVDASSTLQRAAERASATTERSPELT